MMLWENLKMAFGSLRNAKLRSFLTMLGIIIGVAAVTSVIAIGQGVKQAVVGQVSDLGTNLIQVSPGKAFSGDQDDQAGSSGGGFNFAASLGASTLTEEDVKTIQGINSVEAVTPFMMVSGIAKAGAKEATGALVMGTTPDFPRVINQKIGHGSFFKQSDAREAVIGYKTAQQLYGDPVAAIGKTVTLRNQPLKVVGVFEKPKQEGALAGAGFDSVLIMPFSTAKTFNNNVAQIIEIDAKVTSADRVDATKKTIQGRLKANHDGQDDFTVLTQEEQLKVFDQILALLTTFIAAIAAISLVVGGVGIMNIMLVSVTERTREIGLRKAIGASRSAILSQFLIEALTLSILGGALGVALAYGQGLLVSKLANITPVFSLETIALAVGVSAAVGIIFGIAPAIKAARKRPIQALKAE